MEMVRFELDIYKELKKDLGFFDSTCELLEIAVLNLTTDPEYKEKLPRLSKKFNVKINISKENFLDSSFRSLYLVGCHSEFEKFLDLLIDVLKNMKGQTEKKEDKESLFEYSLRLMKPFGGKDKFPKTLVKAIKYYWDLRNAVVHNGVVKSPALEVQEVKELDRITRNQMTSNQVVFDAFKCNISFDDFILYTRCIKKFAELSCLLIRPNNGGEWVYLFKRDFKLSTLDLIHKSKLTRLVNRFYVRYHLNEIEKESFIHALGI